MAAADGSSTRKRGPAAKRMKGEDRRKQILRTAQRVFADRTYHGATTARIAEAAGVTEPTIYLYFKSKKDLYLAVIDDIRRFAVSATAEALRGEGTFRDRYSRLFQGYHQYTLVNPNISRIWINALSVNDPDIQAGLRKIMEEMNALFAGDIRASAEREKVAIQSSPETLGRMLTAVVVGQSLLRIIGGEDSMTWVTRGLDEVLKDLRWGQGRAEIPPR